MTFEPVPPPAKAPVQSEAAALGLLPGLRAGRTHSPYRCGQCNRMIASGDWEVWVPDDVSPSDAAWAVTESARKSAYNGHLTAWCLPCAKRLGAPLAGVRSFWAWLGGVFR